MTAHWLCRLKDAAWIPVGRDRFRVPSEAAVRNPETQAMYRSDDFVAGLGSPDLNEEFADALGLNARVRASDLLHILEAMRDKPEAFDLARARLVYQHLSRLVPKGGPRVGSVGDIPVGDLRRRFSNGTGLVLVLDPNGDADWRRPHQVRRGRQVLPVTDCYVIDRDSFRPLWNVLAIGETGLADCCEYLKEHSCRLGPDDDDGTLIEIYRYMARLLEKPGASGVEGLRHLPLACVGGWRAKRPILLVADGGLRAKLAEARPDRFFWRPPCDTSTD